MKFFLSFFCLLGLAGVSQAPPSLPAGCVASSFNAPIGSCSVQYIDIPFVVDKEGSLRVSMRVDHRDFVPAIVDTGASYVAANDTPDAVERSGAISIPIDTENGEVLEVVNAADVCVEIETRKSICMSATTTFNSKSGAALLGNSFMEQFEHIDIDRKHGRIRFSGRTSDRALTMLIDGQKYNVLMGGKK